MDIDTFVPVSSSIFTRCFAVVLELILYLRTIVCTAERGTFRHLDIAPKDEPDFEVYHFFPPEILADVF